MVETVLIIIASFINIVLAVAIISKRKELSIYNQFFALGSFAVGAWGISTILLNLNTIMLWERVLFTSALSAIFFITLFSFEYKIQKSKLINMAMTIGYLLLLGLLWFTSTIVVSVEKAELGGINVALGKLMPVFTLYVIFALVVLGINLIGGYKETDPIRKQQLRYMIIGIALFVTPALLTNLILPIIGVYSFNNLGVVFSIFFTSSVTVAIVRHRLFSIRTLMLKLLRSALIGVILFAIVIVQRLIKKYLFDLGTFAAEALILDLITAIIVATFIQGLVLWIEKELGRAIKAEVIMLENIAKDIDAQTGNELNLDKVIPRVIPILEKGFMNTNVYFLKVNGSDLNMYPKDSSINIENNSLLSIQSTIIFQENSEENNSQFKTLIEQNIAIISPILKNFYLIIQSKNQRELYSKTELDTLETVITKLRDIFSRVAVYEQTLRFNEELQHRVDEATKDLKQSNKELEEALRKERDMVDIFSHELRTPAGTARNSVQMIEMLAKKEGVTKEEFMEKSKSYIDRAVENMRRLSAIITRMLDASKLDTRNMQVNITEIDAIDVVNDSVASFADKAKQKGLELKLLKPNTPVTAHADRDATQEVIDNLVDNAIKYTAQGTVTLALEVLDDFVKFTVNDTGRGIPPEEIPNLGKKFYRVDNYLSTERKTNILRPDGTGIGLYVVKGLVQMMGGRLEIQSQGRDKGSTFTVFLPR